MWWGRTPNEFLVTLPRVRKTLDAASWLVLAGSCVSKGHSAVKNVRFAGETDSENQETHDDDDFKKRKSVLIIHGFASSPTCSNLLVTPQWILTALLWSFANVQNIDKCVAHTSPTKVTQGDVLPSCSAVTEMPRGWTWEGAVLGEARGSASGAVARGWNPSCDTC